MGVSASLSVPPAPQPPYLGVYRKHIYIDALCALPSLHDGSGVSVVNVNVCAQRLVMTYSFWERDEQLMSYFFLSHSLALFKHCTNVKIPHLHTYNLPLCVCAGNHKQGPQYHFEHLQRYGGCKRDKGVRNDRWRDTNEFVYTTNYCLCGCEIWRNNRHLWHVVGEL